MVVRVLPTPMGTEFTRRSLLRSAAGGTVAAVGAGSAAAQEETETGTGTPAGGGETHVVDMTDELIFDPDSITIAPGDTVVWENVGQIGHSITAYEEDQPEGVEFWSSGDLGSESEARSAYPAEGDVVGGESYEHTFETTGTFPYFCIPHESVGMLGDIVVQEGGATAEPTGVPLPEVPNSAKSLALAMGTVMSAVLALAYFFLKYGGDYEMEE
jgi:plastocyanin